MTVKAIIDPSNSIADYQRGLQPLIDSAHMVYLRVVNLDDLDIKYDYPRIKLADGQVVADTAPGKKPSGGEDIRYEYPARELKATGEHKIAIVDHYTPAGKHVVDEWITLHRDKVMAFPVVRAVFLLANYGRILEELDGPTGRRLLLEQQVAEDAAAESLDVEPTPNAVEFAEESEPAEPTKPKPAFLKGSKGKTKKAKAKE
jgi:hypothetical protein